MTTKILILSDIHLEFHWFFIPEMENEKDIIVVLAGDIGVAKKPHTYMDFIRNTCGRFKDVLWVFGNHEHYRGNFPTSHAKVFAEVFEFENLYILEKETEVIDGIAFIGATMWTDMDNNNPMVMYDAKQFMNDYNQIRTGPESEPWRQKLAPIDTVATFLRTKEFIFPEIEAQMKEGNKVVVITHHLPSYLSIAERRKGDSLNGAYASELGNEIAYCGAELWIHGHTHDSSDYMIGDTRIICNPRGYVPDEPNPEFDDTKIIEI